MEKIDVSLLADDDHYPVQFIHVEHGFIAYRHPLFHYFYNYGMNYGIFLSQMRATSIWLTLRILSVRPLVTMWPFTMFIGAATITVKGYIIMCLLSYPLNFALSSASNLVERDSSAAECRTRKWESWYCFEALAFLLSPGLPQFTQLYKWVPGYRRWWKCQWIVVARNCCMAIWILPREVVLVPERTGLPGGEV